MLRTTARFIGRNDGLFQLPRGISFGVRRRRAATAGPRKKAGPMPEWSADVCGRTVRVSARTKSEARARIKAEIGGPIPPRTIVYRESAEWAEAAA